ncbi:MAG: hypothetical protein OXC46_01350 [Thaumarchaeota archaeon]|nr:hypothetical protein [Nitrososphaerota archaeon]
MLMQFTYNIPQDSYNYVSTQGILLIGIKSVGRFFLFIVGGLVAIIVGSFMIRGTMHLWDKPDKDPDDKNNS